MQKKLPTINSAHGSETRNIINEIIKVVNDRGLEILSESGFLTWLEKNGIKHRGEVATVSDLPSSDSLNTVRGVADENKIYIKKESGWVAFQSIDINKINVVEENLDTRGVNILDFGAIGDGKTNDINAFKAAFKFIEDNGGIGNIIFPGWGREYILDFDGVADKRPFTFTSKMKKITLEGVSKPIIKIADGVTYASLFYSTQSRNLEFESKNIIYDGNSINTPKNTGDNPNPRDDAQRVFELYGKKMVFNDNEFINFAGVNVVIANRNALCQGKSRTEFVNNKTINFGYDPSGSVHDNSVFYSHTQFSALPGTDDHTVVARDNEFEASSSGTKTNAFNAMELGGKFITCTGNITDKFHCGVILSHQFPIHSAIVKNNQFISAARGIYVWATKTIDILPNVHDAFLSLDISDNTVHLDEEYWSKRDVYSNAKTNHRYSYVLLNENFGRNIKNFAIKNNTYYSSKELLSNHPLTNAISLNQVELDYYFTPSIENLTIGSNTIDGHPNKGIFINVPKLKNVSIFDNSLYNIGEKKKSDKRIIDIRGKISIENIELMNNDIEMLNSDYGIYIAAPTINNLKSDNNRYLESGNKNRLGYLHILNPATNVYVNENLPKRVEGDITKLKDCDLTFCDYRTPDGILNADKTLSYKAESITALPSRTYFRYDKLEITEPIPGGFKNFLCTSPGTKGTWKGYGMIEI